MNINRIGLFDSGVYGDFMYLSGDQSCIVIYEVGEVNFMEITRCMILHYFDCIEIGYGY